MGIRGHSGSVLLEPQHVSVTSEIHIQRDGAVLHERRFRTVVKPLVNLRVPVGERKAGRPAMIGSREIHYLVLDIGVAGKPAIVDAVPVLVQSDEHIHRPLELGHLVVGYMTGGGGVVARIGPDARLLPHVAIHRDAPRTGHRYPSDFESGYIPRAFEDR